MTSAVGIEVSPYLANRAKALLAPHSETAEIINTNVETFLDNPAFLQQINHPDWQGFDIISSIEGLSYIDNVPVFFDQIQKLMKKSFIAKMKHRKSLFQTTFVIADCYDVDEVCKFEKLLKSKFCILKKEDASCNV